MITFRQAVWSNLSSCRVTETHAGLNNLPKAPSRESNSSPTLHPLSTRVWKPENRVSGFLTWPYSECEGTWIWATVPIWFGRNLQWVFGFGETRVSNPTFHHATYLLYGYLKLSQFKVADCQKWQYFHIHYLRLCLPANSVQITHCCVHVTCQTTAQHQIVGDGEPRSTESSPKSTAAPRDTEFAAVDW